MEPGSFLNLMIDSKHSNGEPFSDLLASSQAFTFLLVSCLSDRAKALCMPCWVTVLSVCCTVDKCWRCEAPVAVDAGGKLEAWLLTFPWHHPAGWL